jgi:Protein of unknown function (DUF2808)
MLVNQKSLLHQALPVLAVISSTLCILPSRAEYNLFSGVAPKDQLNHRLDFGRRSISDSYRLNLPGSKLRLGAVQINILYPEYYSGIFDEQKVTVQVGDKVIPIAGVKWQKDRRTLQIDLKERLQTKGDINIVLGNVRNPDSSGLYYFDCQVKSSPNFPIARYAGTWILNIN